MGTDNEPRPFDFSDLLNSSEPDCRMLRMDPEIRTAVQHAKKEAEIKDIEAFLAA